MDRLQEIDRFAEALGSAADIDALFAVVGREVARLGFQRYNYALMSGLDGGHNGFFKGTYPAAWSERYVGRRYEADDPVTHLLARTLRPFTFRDAAGGAHVTNVQRLVHDEAREFGLMSGCAVGVSGPGAARARFALASSAAHDAFEKDFQHHRHEIYLIATYTHERAIELLAPTTPALRVRLTPREAEVLKWAAMGKSNWEIANILSVAEPTIKEHVSNICGKFGVKTKTHAASLAVWHGYISL